MLRFWGEQAPFLRKMGSMLGKTRSVFGENRLRFWEKTGSVFGTKWLRFGENRRSLGKLVGSVLDWLGTRLKFHCFER